MPPPASPPSPRLSGGDVPGPPPEGTPAQQCPEIYHERQVGALCALHCLNNMLQGPIFNESSLREVTQELDQAERALTEGRGLDEGNARTDGFFNVQVMQVVLGQKGFDMFPLRGPASWSAQFDPVKETAFILNRQQHWFALRRIGMEWFDLNSKLRNPRKYEDADLRQHLGGFMREGYTVFVVRGDFEPWPLMGRATLAEVSVGVAAAPEAACEDLAVLAALQYEFQQEARHKGCPHALVSFIQHWFSGARFGARVGAAQGSRGRAKMGAGKVGADSSWPQGSPSGSAWASPDDQGRDIMLGQEDQDSLAPEPARSRDYVVPPAASAREAALEGESGPAGRRGRLAARCGCLAAKAQAQHRPVFVLLQSVVVTSLWLAFALQQGTEGITQREAGLDSALPGRTRLAINRDCEDLRTQVWRWLTYQFTQHSPVQLVMDLIVLGVAGVPLEAFYGSLWACVFFNAGVLGGAGVHLATNAHAEPLVGISAGCYGLLGMHFADVAMTWSRCRYRAAKLALLTLLICVDSVYVQSVHWGVAAFGVSTALHHASRLGGLLAGLLVGVRVAPTRLNAPKERIVRSIALGALVMLLMVCVAWIAQWPPRTLVDPTPWCWARQVFNASLFDSPSYQCVRCQSQACVERWSRQEWIVPVDSTLCDEVHGWTFSEGG